jgi:hypothetical protein
MPLKMTEQGVSKEIISMLQIPLGLASMGWPFLFGKHTSKMNQMMLCYKVLFIK